MTKEQVLKAISDMDWKENDSLKSNEQIAIERMVKEIEINRKVELFADRVLHNEQLLDEIREGFENGLSIEQVKFYANPKYDHKQMWIIRKGFEKDLSIEQVQSYADPKYDWKQIREIYIEFMQGLSIEQICGTMRSSNEVVQNDEMTDEEEYSYSM